MYIYYIQVHIYISYIIEWCIHIYKNIYIYIYVLYLFKHIHIDYPEEVGELVKRYFNLTLQSGTREHEDQNFLWSQAGWPTLCAWRLTIWRRLSCQWTARFQLSKVKAFRTMHSLGLKLGVGICWNFSNLLSSGRSGRQTQSACSEVHRLQPKQLPPDITGAANRRGSLPGLPWSSGVGYGIVTRL